MTANSIAGGFSATATSNGVTVPASFSLANTYQAPTIGKVFSPGTIVLSGTSALTFTLVNPAPNTGALTGVSFTDTLPGSLVVATPNGLTGGCGGGSITAIAGSNNVSLSGATLAQNGSCSFTVNVTATSPGNYFNTTGAVSSTNGSPGGTASAALVVQPDPIPALSHWGLALISGLTILTGLFALRRRQQGSA